MVDIFLLVGSEVKNEGAKCGILVQRVGVYDCKAGKATISFCTGMLLMISIVLGVQIGETMLKSCCMNRKVVRIVCKV